MFVLFKLAISTIFFGAVGVEEPKTTSIFPSQLDFSVPTSPALSILGIDASKAVSPGNVQELVLGLVNSFDEAGKLRQGFQVTSTLSRLGIGPRFATGGTKFFRDPSIRINWASNLSIAATKGATEEDPSARAAIGLSLPLLDDTDWRGNDDAVKEHSKILAATLLKDLDYHIAPDRTRDEVEKREYEKRRAYFQTVYDGLGADADSEAKPAVKQLLDAIDLLIADITKDENQAKVVEYLDNVFGFQLVDSKDYEKKLATFMKEKEKEFWNKRKFVISVAHSFFAENAAEDSLTSDGTFFWLNYSDALGKNAQYTVFARYAKDDRAFDNDAETWTVGDSKQLAARIKGGTGKSGFFIEYSAKEIKNGSERTRQTVWQGGYEVSVGDGQWLQIALGDGKGKGIAKNVLGVLFSINISKERALIAP